jgi:hypothetical protein
MKRIIALSLKFSYTHLKKYIVIPNDRLTMKRLVVFVTYLKLSITL